MSTRHKPLQGQLPLAFMVEPPRRARRPKLVVVRAEPEDQPAEAKPKPVAKTRRKKAG